MGIFIPRRVGTGTGPVQCALEDKMRVALIDADSVIPNLALMKLSTWHKSKGDSVCLFRAHLPYYPYKKKSYFFADKIGADKVYCSVVFGGNREYIVGTGIVFGGTGHDLQTELPAEIENCSPDYTLYPENDISYGFITRGCIRKCPFCVVPRKEGHIRKVAEIRDIVYHKKTCFLDNNILAYPEHKTILKELCEEKIKCQFNQGLDIRLVDQENARLLSKMNYFGDYIFAFDSWKYRGIIEEKLEILKWRKPFQFKFFVYVHPDMSLSQTVKRVMWLRQRELLPYIMRDISCWKSSFSSFYTDVAAYCNQVGLFKKLDFLEFLNKRHKNQERITESAALWQAGI